MRKNRDDIIKKCCRNGNLTNSEVQSNLANTNIGGTEQSVSIIDVVKDMMSL